MKKSIIRLFSVTLLLSFINEVFFPICSFALTSGPTAPEVTNFEPVDTTDLVNLQTGSLVYTIPVLNVPGSEEGYPLALSYHSGIKTEQEASWVGLGFTLNAGSVSRTVNGYPDDINGASQMLRDYWTGGKTVTRTFGLQVPILGYAGIEASVSVSHDTFKGTGVGGYAGVYGGYGPASIHAGIGVQAYTGHAYLSLTGSGTVGIPGGSASVFKNFTTDLSNGTSRWSSGWSASFGVPAIGISLSSQGTSYSVRGYGWGSNTSNSKKGIISTSTHTNRYGFIFHTSVTTTRYWSDETTNPNIYGSLYDYTGSDYINNASDTYTVPIRSANLNFEDPDKEVGGSFPDYDHYTVMAQGVGGNMRPFQFQRNLHIQSKIKYDGGNKYYDVQSANIPSNSSGGSQPTPAPFFRFEDEYTNYYTQDNPGFVQINPPNLQQQFDPSPSFGLATSGTQRLAGGKHIQFFTNHDILTNVASSYGFRDVSDNLDGNSILSRPDNMAIGGFMITNESGVNYHFALPVYTGNEYQKSTQITDIGNYSTKQSPNIKYAYAWNLTSITGPDYVSRANITRDNPSKISKNDWGYWVNFRYDKEASSYQWRSPYSGYHIDKDANFQVFSTGQKELFCLSSIETDSHIALFLKSARSDGIDVGNINVPFRLDQIILMTQSDFGATHNGYPITDPSNVNAFLSRSLKVVRFVYDYSQCPANPNSRAPLGGRLTLRSIDMLGKNAIKVVPSTTFQYDLNELPGSNTAVFFNVATILNVPDNEAIISCLYLLSTGDIISYNDPSGIQGKNYGVIRRYAGDIIYSGKSISNAYYIKFFRPPSSFVIQGANGTITKNPPYLQDYDDVWGFYKADFSGNITNQNIAKHTTATSAAGTDSWSLRAIHNSLGSIMMINYSSNDYSYVPFYTSKTLPITVNSLGGNGVLNCSIADPVSLSDYFTAGSWVPFVFYTGGGWLGITGCSNQLTTSVQATFTNFNGNQFQLTNLDQNTYNNFSSILNGSSRCAIKAASILVNWPSGNLYGGGPRVKSVSLTSPADNMEYTSNYDYSNSTTGGVLSSGVTSSEEGFVYPVPITSKDYQNGLTNTNPFKAYNDMIKEDYENYLEVSRFLPAPGIMYGYVSVSRKVTSENATNSVPSSTVYSFITPSLGDFYYQAQGATTQNFLINGGNYYTTNLRYQDFSSQIGQPTAIYDLDKDGHPLRETQYQYAYCQASENSPKSSGSIYGNQGVIQERYGNTRIVTLGDHSQDGNAVIAVMTQRESYPTVLSSVTVKDYKVNSVKKITYNKFDPLTGDPVSQTEVDQYGNSFLSQILPAYTQYPAMGSKAINQSNSNMLSQQAVATSYRQASGVLPQAVVSSAVTTWSNQIPVLTADGSLITQSGVWRPSASYAWLPQGATLDGLTPLSSFVDYFTGSTNPSWIQTSSVTLNNVFSGVNEEQDINGNYQSSKLGYSGQRIVSMASGSKYNEQTYSGTEDGVVNGHFLSGTAVNQGIISSSFAHTGNNSLQVTGGKMGFSFGSTSSNWNAGKAFKSSVWIKTDNGAKPSAILELIVDGQPKASVQASKSKRAGDWYLLDLNSALPAGSVYQFQCRNTGTSTVYMDDFRVCPTSSSMMSYVFDPHSFELAYLLDGNNLYTHYEYDAAGRLTRTSHEFLGLGSKVISENQYHYKGQ